MNLSSNFNLAIGLLLLVGEKTGNADEGTCIRNTDEVLIHVATHNYGYIDRFNDLVQDLVTKTLISPNLGEMINRQLKIATRDVCSIRELQRPTTRDHQRPTPRWVGRIPRQAFLGGVIATLGLLEVGRTLEHLVLGVGYGDRFEDYMNKIRRTENTINLRMSKLEMRIRKLEDVAEAGLLVEEIQSILQIEEEEWDDIRNLDEDLRGNAILRDGFELAEKIYEKRNLTKAGGAGDTGLRKLKIDKRLRTMSVEVRTHNVCKWAWLKVTSITAIPSKDCHRKVGTLGRQNLTLAETKMGSCLVLGRWESAVELGDGSVYVPTNAWERKKMNCELALKNEDVYFKEIKGDLYVGSRTEFRITSRCGESKQFLTNKVENTTVIPKPTCRGWISINGLNGKRDEWAATRTKVSSGKPGLSGALVTTESWMFNAFDEELDQEEVAEEEDEEQLGQESEWDWNVEKTAVGSSTTLVAGVALTVVGIWYWRRRAGEEGRKRSDTYVGYNHDHDNNSSIVKIDLGGKGLQRGSNLEASWTSGAGDENERQERKKKNEEPEKKNEEAFEMSLGQELSNIAVLTNGILQAGEGMSAMISSLEQMAGGLEKRNENGEPEEEGSWPSTDV